jgi:hypothetical protein
MIKDIEDIAAELDDTIEKGAKASEKLKSIKKSYSFNPFEPIVVDPSSPFAIHYQWNQNGGFLPYEAKHWAALGKDPSGYATTTDFYDRYIYMIKGLRELSKDLLKGECWDGYKVVPNKKLYSKSKSSCNKPKKKSFSAQVEFKSLNGEVFEHLFRGIVSEDEKEARDKIIKGLADIYGSVEIVRIRIENQGE